MEWTKEQQQVIEARNSSLLVSAAAGSGKTAVLVERIMQMITDKTNPIDIDTLLVVTFTNAAASQMREKLQKALVTLQEEKPADAHLTKQLALLNRANIMTIDSFCLKVVRENFHLVGLDPNFTIVDAADLKVMEEEAVDEALEQAYQRGEEDFLNFVNCFGNDKNDASIGDYMLQVIQAADSYPRPYAWLDSAREALLFTTIDDIERQPWFAYIRDAVKLQVKTFLEELEYARELCKKPYGPTPYLKTLNFDEELFKNVLSAKDYEGLYQSLSQKFANIERIKKADGEIDGEIKETVMKLRAKYKEAFKKLNIFKDREQVLSECKNIGTHMTVLLGLAEQYRHILDEKKKKDGVLTFADVEHYALDILSTDVAMQYRRTYTEIMIDEYQDSNYLQEEILLAVSGCMEGRDNVFMVGDVKQSIYRFRMARPDLFIHKYDTYKEYAEASEADRQKKIELHANFRSRSCVVDAVNYIFRQIMGEDLGGIVYDDKAALVASLPFPETDLPVSRETELLLLETKQEDGADTALSDSDAEEDGPEADKAELEAQMIANRILKMVGKMGEKPLKVYASDNNSYRDVSFGDIAILFRNLTQISVFMRVLTDAGIPVVSDASAGLLETMELRTLLALLTVIDNPDSDISLAAVLHAPFYGFTSEELAAIRVFADRQDKRHTGFFRAVCLFAKAQDLGEEQKTLLPLQKRVNACLRELQQFRDKSKYMEITELLAELLSATNYLTYLQATVNGDRRVANVHYLISMAKSFSANGGKDLFSFVNYMRQRIEKGIDVGEADLQISQSDNVRIMSMHKSKGLEFPVVFVSGTGRQFNLQDAKEQVIVHNDYYLAAPFVSAETRSRHDSFMRMVFKDSLLSETIAEEMRILYVALTRAKEKLIITGHISNLQTFIEQWEKVTRLRAQVLPYGYRRQSPSYLKWILLALMRNPDFNKEAGAYQIPADFSLHVERFTAESLEFMRYMDDDRQLERRSLYRELKEQEKKDSIFDMLAPRFAYQYPYRQEVEHKAKYAVTEISALTSEEPVDVLSATSTREPASAKTVPVFMQEETKPDGAARGTALHKIMEMYDFTEYKDAKTLEAQIKSWQDAEILPTNTLDVIDVKEIAGFFESQLGQRMRTAEARGVLVKEKPFVISVSGRELFGEEATEDTILVQGIIDAYFEDEDGTYVVVDYKSDRGKLPIEPYTRQLHYYAATLERLKHKKVKQCYLYAFTEGKAIPV